MSFARRSCCLVALLLTNCTDDSPAPVPLESACPLTDTVRIADFPPGWPPADPKIAHADLTLLGDKLVVRWDVYGPDEPPPELFLIDPCGPTTEVLAPAALDLRWVDVRDEPAGPVAYSVGTGDDTLYRLDRLDLPGIDPPQPLFTFAEPTDAFSLGTTLAFTVGGDTHFSWTAAGIGLEPAEIWLFGPGDDVPVPFAEDIVASQYRRHDDGSYAALMLTDAGALTLYPQFPGPAEILQTGVRHARITPDWRYLVWQELGDGLAEPVHLRDLDTNSDIELTINDFVAESFGKAPIQMRFEDYIGSWFVPDDSSAVALLGPDMTLVRAFLTATGEALDVPEHLPFTGSDVYCVYRDSFELTLPDPGENVAALWTPGTDSLRVVYRGPDTVDFVDFDHADPTYRRYPPPNLFGDTDPNFSLWALDPDTGASTQLLPRVGSHIETLDDGRLLYGVSDKNHDHELTVYDPDTRVFTTFGSLASSWEHLPDLGVAYVDLYSSSPGLYVAPIPPKRLTPR